MTSKYPNHSHEAAASVSGRLKKSLVKAKACNSHLAFPIRSFFKLPDPISNLFDDTPCTCSGHVAVIAGQGKKKDKVAQ